MVHSSSIYRAHRSDNVRFPTMFPRHNCLRARLVWHLELLRIAYSIVEVEVVDLFVEMEC